MAAWSLTAPARGGGAPARAAPAPAPVAWRLNRPAWATELRAQAAEFYAKGKYGAAEFVLRQMLAVMDEEMVDTEERHVEMAQIMYRLAQCYMHMGRHWEHEQWLEKGLQKLDGAIGGDDVQATGCIARYRCLADLCACAARRAAHAKGAQETHDASQYALALGTRALAIAERVFGAMHTGTAEALVRAGACQQRVGRYDEAEAAMRRAYHIRAAVDGERHPNTARVCHALAQLYRVTHRHERAARYAALARACATPEQWEREQRLRGGTHVTAAAASAALAQRVAAARAGVMALPCDPFAREAVNLPAQQAIVTLQPEQESVPHGGGARLPPHVPSVCTKPFAPMLPPVGVAAGTILARKRTSTVGRFRDAPAIERKPQVVPKLDLALVHDEELEDEDFDHGQYHSGGETPV